jgi:succinate dehydrogenase / fumarate reductase cytochrome b subunit
MLRRNGEMYTSKALSGRRPLAAGPIHLHPTDETVPTGMSTSTVRAAKPRPKHLDLTKIRLPLPGWVSIMHRASGAALFLMLPFLLWLLDASLDTEVGYEMLKGFLSQAWVKLILFGLVWAYLHHFCAGIRYLMLDMHKGIELAPARASAVAVYVVSIPLALLVAWRLFL